MLVLSLVLVQSLAQALVLVQVQVLVLVLVQEPGQLVVPVVAGRARGALLGGNKSKSKSTLCRRFLTSMPLPQWQHCQSNNRINSSCTRTAVAQAVVQ